MDNIIRVSCLIYILALLASCNTPVEEITFDSLQDGWYDSPSWSPAGDELLINDRGARSNFYVLRIGVQDGKISNGTAIEEQAAWLYPVWSPQGGEFAIVQTSPDGTGIYVISLDGKLRESVVLFTDHRDIDKPSWSPDGSQIAFSADIGEGFYGLFIVNRDGTGLMRIETEASHKDDWDPQWSPKGNALVFVSGDRLQRQGDIYALYLNSGEAINLTNTPQICENSPTWSPDGQWIGFATSQRIEEDTYYGVGLMRADGTSIRQLICDAPFLYYDLAWSPDGEQIAAAKQYYIDEYGHYSCTIVLIRVDVR